MKLLVQPIDMDDNVIVVLSKFGSGASFSYTDMMVALNKPYHWVRRFSRELRDVLSECPEGLQLEVTRGAHGGHRFG